MISMLHKNRKQDGGMTNNGPGSQALPGLDRQKAATNQSQRVGLFPLNDQHATNDFDIDIVAVHGLGGHWEQTWKDNSNGSVWIRDFLPIQLRESNLNPRILSYGYDSRTVLSKNVTDISDVADDILDRLSIARSEATQNERPIIFIAHSLGGLVVKKAMITAWNQSNRFGQLLQCVKGVVFFGVPHRGTDLADWAGLPLNLLQVSGLGFGGNPAFLNSLKRASPICRDISVQFIERAAPPLMIRTFFETEKLGNLLIVDKDSARLFLPNEQVVGIANSNHKSMCKFEDANSQRYIPVGKAIRDMAIAVVKTSKTNSGQIPLCLAAYNIYERIIMLLLDQNRTDIAVTEEVSDVAAANSQKGLEIMTLLLERYRGEITITGELVNAAAKSEGNGKEVMKMLLNGRRKDVQITEETVALIVANFESDVVALL